MAGREDVYKEAMSQGHSAAWDGNWKRAADQYQAAVAEFPDRQQAISSLGLAFFELTRYEDAKKCYERGVALAPDDPLPVEKIAEIHERMGSLKEAAEFSMRAADLYLKLRDPDKAIENWTRVTQLVPEHLKAHSRMALVFERLGRTAQAIREYINVAALLQDAGQIEEAIKTVEHAVKLDPSNQEGKQAFQLAQANKTLPKPKRQKGGTGPLRMAAVKDMGKMPPELARIGQDTPDPIAESRQQALTALAEVLFDISSDDVDEEKAARRGLRFSLGKESGGPDYNKIAKHVSQAIDMQTRAKEDEAANELKNAIEAGLDFPPAYFSLGLLYFKRGQQESALRNLARSVKHPDYALASRLLIADMESARGDLNDAAVSYLEALKIAECSVLTPDMADIMRQNYEPLIEANAQESDEDLLKQICTNIMDMLMQPNWRKALLEARQQLPTAATGSLLSPLASILTQAKSSEMVEAMARINSLARRGFFRTAMEESFSLLAQAPTYLPLHVHMGELLFRQERHPEAIRKFTMVANAYSSRGEPAQATNLLRRVVEIAPMDMRSRNRLIEQLMDQGQVDDAIEEYTNLADMYYRLAELNNARSTYERALRVAQQADASAAWSGRILHRMADIDMQRLDWRQALRVYEQLRTIYPDDKTARSLVVDLNVRLGQDKQASAELDNYLSYLSSQAKEKDAIEFVDALLNESPELVFARQRLAELYQQTRQAEKAIKEWDVVGETLAQKGDMEGAKQAIRAILVLNPPNVEQYRQLLQRLG
ncbi:MAG: tetratricopeptide repeat protein [Anaerolineae bacterium]|nr:MAG: tetratricopeptide repeat protein [Anaerolineae bacterium]